MRRAHFATSGPKVLAKEEAMALVHNHEPDRSHDLALCGLAVIVFAIIAAAVPLLKFCVDFGFTLFQ
ncbi:MAG TPA: hypothetical protein VMF58_15540 [Rhizomicrobium sp.]|nr:hypothetical protein [Rhizomicrobium sp.]